MCVCFDARFARREQASGGSGTRRRMERRDRFALAKQTRVETAGVAGSRRARETGKPGRQVRRRGKAAWPHARRTAGPFSPATRAAERGRPLGQIADLDPLDSLRLSDSGCSQVSSSTSVVGTKTPFKKVFKPYQRKHNQLRELPFEGFDCNWNVL